jgi:putative restriction endonuclease
VDVSAAWDAGACGHLRPGAEEIVAAFWHRPDATRGNELFHRSARNSWTQVRSIRIQSSKSRDLPGPGLRSYSGRICLSTLIIAVVDDDLAVRTAAFGFLETEVALHGDVLPRGLLQAGFRFSGRRVPLVGPQGIFKPAILRDMPLSITTAPQVPGKDAPYDDSFGDDELLHYRYRGTDPQHPDNVGLRRAMQTRTPLVYFHGIVPGQYLATWPVFVIGDLADQLTFVVAVDEKHVLSGGVPGTETDVRRLYVTRLQRMRIHQAGFRLRVIAAYREMCAVCRLRHRELLDAAHILPDTDPRGLPLVTNGLALCKLHHAAFDQNIIGVRPDLVIEVNRRILEEIDGPMLVHGLQGFHQSSLVVPRRPEWRPDKTLLEERYEVFRQAG